MERTEDLIVGAWRLRHWRRITNGTVAYPLGHDAVGLLAYLPGGSMIVQMTAGDRRAIDSRDALGGPEAERAAAYSTCLAYFGRYTVEGDVIVHHIDASLYPNWSGTDASRSCTVSRDGLVLSTPPTTAGGDTVVNEMAWTRADAAPPASPLSTRRSHDG